MAGLADAEQLQIDAARVLSVGVENPHLDELIDQDGPALLDDLLGKVGRP